YGPELMRRLCAAAAEQGVPIYLYGGTEEVVRRLSNRLLEWFPKLKIAGAESPPFRPLTPQEDAEAVRRINDSGARLLFLGIGSPKQEVFAFAHRDKIRAVQLCVGAAFDFHAGVKKMAPAWMQRRGLEWLFRLTQEPGRLWKRYLVANTTFLYLFAKAALRTAFKRERPGLDLILGQAGRGAKRNPGYPPRQSSVRSDLSAPRLGGALREFRGPPVLQ